MNDRMQWLVRMVLKLTATETWTGRDMVEGVLILGALGSGKTTGSGFAFANALLRSGYGGLVLIAKPDELKTWATYFRRTGRSMREDAVVIQPDPMHSQILWPEEELGPPRFLRHNILQHEYRSGGRLTDNVVALLYTSLFDGEVSGREDPFWARACRELTTHAVELSVLGTPGGAEEIRLDDLLDIIMSAPTSPQEIDTPRFNKGRCAELIRLADERRGDLPEYRFRDLLLTVRYWLVQFPSLAIETRSSIVATFTSKVTALLRSPLRELLTSHSDPAAAPEVSLRADPVTGRPKIIFLNLPVKLYGDAGRIAQVMYKAAWQRTADRRIQSIEAQDPAWRPAFLWADEAQYFLTGEDAMFQQTARSAMAATVYLTQNLPNLYAELGEARTHSLLGNLQTKVFHANGDPATNEWAERTFGSELQDAVSAPLTGARAPTANLTVLPILPSVRFTELKKGGGGSFGPQPVGAYVFQAGRQWSTPWQIRHYAEFLQDRP